MTSRPDIDLRTGDTRRVLVVRHAQTPEETLSDCIVYEGDVAFTVSPLPRYRGIPGPRYVIRPVGRAGFSEMQFPIHYRTGGPAMTDEDRTVYLLDRGDPRQVSSPSDRASLEMALDVFCVQEGLDGVRFD